MLEQAQVAISAPVNVLELDTSSKISLLKQSSTEFS